MKYGGVNRYAPNVYTILERTYAILIVTRLDTSRCSTIYSRRGGEDLLPVVSSKARHT